MSSDTVDYQVLQFTLQNWGGGGDASNLSNLHFQELKAMDTDKDVSVRIRFDNVSILHVKPESSERQTELFYSMYIYYIFFVKYCTS